MAKRCPCDSSSKKAPAKVVESAKPPQVEIDGVACGATTRGHRFHHPGPITIGGAHDYVEKLRACHVIVDQEERESTVREGAIQAAEDAGYLLVQDEGLVVENAGLTSLPVPLLGELALLVYRPFMRHLMRGALGALEGYVRTA